MEQGMWMGAIVLTLGTVILVTFIIQLTAAWKARTSLTRERGYRDLAERATVALAESADRLKRVEAELGDLKSRLGSVEKLLHDVE